MKKFIIILFFALCIQSFGQERLLDKAGQVRFYSEAPVENIEATNNQALAIFDVGTNKVAASVLMKGFHFEKALMEEHFNENYVESDKYPKATFSGTLSEPIDLSKEGEVTVTLNGEMALHGEKNPLTCDVLFTISEDKIAVSTSFMVRVADYKIKIPSLVIDNIAEEVEVTAKFQFSKP